MLETTFFFFLVVPHKIPKNKKDACLKKGYYSRCVQVHYDLLSVTEAYIAKTGGKRGIIGKSRIYIDGGSMEEGGNFCVERSQPI